MDVLTSIVEFDREGFGTDRRRGALRPRFPAERWRLLLPDRAIGRREDLAAQASLSGTTSDPGPRPAVRRELSEAPRTALPAFRRRIGVIYQDFRLIHHLSAFDNVALPLLIAGSSDRDIDGPVREMLAWVGLSDRASARPATLSGGEQQRVAIARAVIARPELLIADEPTGNVDSEMAQRILFLLTALNRLGTTIIVATHDMSLVKATPGAHMMRLDQGQVVDPTGVLRNPPQRSDGV